MGLRGVISLFGSCGPSGFWDVGTFVYKKVIQHTMKGKGSHNTLDSMTDIDQRVRIAAFKWLDEQVGIHGDVLPRSLLAQGFIFNGQRVPLVAPTGIFKPRVLPQMD